MKKLLLIVLLGVSAQAFAQAVKIPWTDKCVRLTSLKPDMKIVNTYSEYAWVRAMWAEVAAQMGEHMKIPNLEISLEYLNYRTGFLVTNTAEYASGCNDFPADEEMDEELASLHKKADAGTLHPNDFKGARWIHLIQPMDAEEANCLALSKTNGVYAGCADQWQGGITDDKAVCLKGKSYLRCHVECMEKIYDHKINYKSGFCQ